MGNQKTTSSTISLSTLVFIVFLVLKLAEIGAVATWSWWWVTAPLWIPLCLAVSVLAVVGLVFLFINKR